MKETISLFVRRPVTVIMAMAALGIAAVFSLIHMPIERLPELSVPQVLVETRYNGMTAADIRSMVSIPVEDALSPVKGLQRIRSVSRDNVSMISLDFRWGSDVMTAAALVREAIDAVYPSLPHGINKPVVTPQNSGTQAHAIVAVRSPYGDNRFARHLAEYELRTRLRQIDGVASVVLVGGETEEQRLRLDMQRLAARGIKVTDFVRLVSGETVDIPSGNVREGNRELVAVSSGRPASAEELSGVLVPAASGAFLLSDAGELNLEAARRKSVFVVDGTEAAALEIYRRPGADPLRLSREINQTVTEAASLFSNDADIFVVRDASSSLISGITSLGISAALGAIAVIITLFVFIKRIRYSILAGLSIPLSASFGIIVLAVAGKSLNSMSLGGLALGIGLVSDVSVITLDLLHRSFASRKDKPSPCEIGSCAASIAGSSMASTITTSVVFVPIIFLPGPLGSLFGDMAIALVSSVIAGWLYAQFCLTSLFNLFFNNNKKSNLIKIGKKNTKLEEKYRLLLAPFIRRPQKIIIATALIIISGSVILFSRPLVFVSPDEAKEICVSLNFISGTLLNDAADTACVISRTLSEVPGIKTIFGRAGAEDEDISRRADIDYRKEELLLSCELAGNVKPEKVMAEIQQLMDNNHGGFEFQVSLPKDQTEALLGLSSEWSFAVTGKDRKETSARAELAHDRLKNFSDSAPPALALRPQGLRPELRLFPNRELISYLGITGADLAEVLFILNEGIIATTMEIEGNQLDVRISGSFLTDSNSPEILLENIPFLSDEGRILYLGSLGRIERRDAESAFARAERNDVIYLDIIPTSNKSFKNYLDKMCNDFPWFVKIDDSVFSKYRNSLLINICLVLILLYMVMGAQFESFLLPLLIMLSIPISLAGAGPVMLLCGVNLDSGAVLGLITLFGLVINNGLILFEIGEQRINEGVSPAIAVYGGAAERVRPVLITSLTTIIALLPLVFNPLANSQKSMAAAMIGGMFASTALSLFVLPPLLLRFFRRRNK